MHCMSCPPTLSILYFMASCYAVITCMELQGSWLLKPMVWSVATAVKCSVQWWDTWRVGGSHCAWWVGIAVCALRITLMHTKTCQALSCACTGNWCCEFAMWPRLFALHCIAPGSTALLSVIKEIGCTAVAAAVGTQLVLTVCEQGSRAVIPCCHSYEPNVIELRVCS